MLWRLLLCFPSGVLHLCSGSHTCSLSSPPGPCGPSSSRQPMGTGKGPDPVTASSNLQHLVGRGTTCFDGDSKAFCPLAPTAPRSFSQDVLCIVPLERFLSFSLSAVVFQKGIVNIQLCPVCSTMDFWEAQQHPCTGDQPYSSKEQPRGFPRGFPEMSPGVSPTPLLALSDNAQMSCSRSLVYFPAHSSHTLRDKPQGCPRQLRKPS